MISKWTPEDFIIELERHGTREQAKIAIEDFLDEGEFGNVNQFQRIILLAEDFDFEVLTTAEWLYERYQVDIRCYRLALAINGNEEFLTCTRIYPPPELTAQAKRRGGMRLASSNVRNLQWEDALARIENPAVVSFFKAEAEAGREKVPGKASLKFRGRDKVRYRMSARLTFAYVSQRGRFASDDTFWAERLSAPAQIRSVGGGKRLRFHLQTDQDFQNFRKAWDETLQDVPFVRSSTDNEDFETDEIEE